MLNGAMSHYRRSPVLPAHPAGRQDGDSAGVCPQATPDDHAIRAGAPADNWDAWMITRDSYRLKTSPEGELLGLDLDVHVLKKRPVRRNPPRAEEALELLRHLLDSPTDDDSHEQ
ncbi:hypothetical protein [Streptomyces phytophilus]|uniref:hypothetical protein n=1 Tax=Streptomyces phytophilus TaxID=722715 RepID=UPI0015F03D3A|nr:hypothetical protein [Streptomyces phytophilus]